MWDGNNPLHEWVEYPAIAPGAQQLAQLQSTANDIRADQRQQLLQALEPQGPPAFAQGSIATPVTWLFEPESFAPMAKLVGDEHYSIITDHLGTPNTIFDKNGQQVWSTEIGVWGELRQLRGEKDFCPFRFPGQYEDSETGLYYNRFRYYDPTAGQYVSQDPILLAGGTALYGYVKDLMILIDPFGLMPWAWNPDTGMGHHLVPRGKANSVGLDLLGTNRDTPTFFPNPYEAGMHEELHRAQRPHVGKLQGPWTGTADELIEASKKGLKDVPHLLGDLKIPSTGKILAKNVTPEQAFDALMSWHREQLGGSTCS